MNLRSVRSQLNHSTPRRVNRGEGFSLEQMLTKDYVIGLADGEGSFTVYVRDPKATNQRKRRVIAEARFTIKLIEKDKKILDELKKFFGCGNVYFQKDTRLRHQNCYRFEIANRQHLKDRVIPFFRKNKLRFPSKQKDFALFCRLISDMDKNMHKTPEGLLKMHEIKKQMH